MTQKDRDTDRWMLTGHTAAATTYRDKRVAHLALGRVELQRARAVVVVGRDLEVEHDGGFEAPAEDVLDVEGAQQGLVLVAEMQSVAVHAYTQRSSRDTWGQMQHKDVQSTSK